MSPRLTLLALIAIAFCAASDFARAQEACCQRPASRSALLTGKKAAATEGCDEPVVDSGRKLSWPVLSMIFGGGAAVGVGAFCAARKRRV